jgi:competence protein ComFB
MTQKTNEEVGVGGSASIKLSPRQERVMKSALEEKKHHVYNVVEIIANETVADVMERMDMCTCSQCTGDVLALALNALPTKYVTSDAGKQYIQLASFKKQFETDVEIALMKACMTVKAAPNHNGQ